MFSCISWTIRRDVCACVSSFCFAHNHSFSCVMQIDGVVPELLYRHGVLLLKHKVYAESLNVLELVRDMMLIQHLFVEELMVSTKRSILTAKAAIKRAAAKPAPVVRPRS